MTQKVSGRPNVVLKPRRVEEVQRFLHLGGCIALDLRALNGIATSLKAECLRASKAAAQRLSTQKTYGKPSQDEESKNFKW